MTTNNDLHVIFGAGPTGLATAEALSKQGYTVRVATRSGKAVADPFANLTVVQGDAGDTESVRRVAEGAAAVYNCVGLPYHKWVTDYLPLQRALVEGVASVGARLVSMENVYMYGDTAGAPITEDLPYAAHTRKGRVRAQMAEELMAAHEAGKLQVAIGRASDFFGPFATWQSPLGDRVIYPALEGKAASVLGDPDMPHSYTYVKDIGAALATLGTRDEALGQVWHIPNAPVQTTRDILNLIFEETGHAPKVSPAPRLILRMMGLFNPVVRELDEMLYEFTQPFIVESGRFEATFGLSATPLPEAIHETVEWFRANPKA